MKSFRTIVKTSESKNKIDYNSDSVFIGSCFSENIGNQLKSYKFSTDINPFGVLYNPISISNSIEILLRQKKFKEKDLQFHNDLWFSFSHHSSFSDSNKEICLKKINDKIQSSYNKLKEAKFLFISYGTSRVYLDKRSGEIVSNCHKLPSSTFEQKLINVEENYEVCERMIKDITRINPDIQIVFTISPIRHWKDGHFANQVNKSVLFILINMLVEKFENVTYFPSYEIMMDDLRDYRFYADDMIHINETAIKYIFEQFSNAYLNDNVRPTLKQVTKISNAFNHRPFNPSSDSYLKFAEENLQIINQVLEDFPHIDFQNEIDFFNNILT